MHWRVRLLKCNSQAIPMSPLRHGVGNMRPVGEGKKQGCNKATGTRD